MADFQRLMQLVEDALSLPSEDRASFLREECGSDHALFDEANKLAAKTTSNVLDAKAGAADAETAPSRVVIAGRYELGEIVGEGGMGTVHRARDLRFDRDVAVKLLKPGVPADSPAAMRFQVESRITGQLQHPGIPPAYELGLLPGGLPFLAMKLVRGRTLRNLLKDRTSHSEDLSRFIAVFEQIAHAVGYAHSHRVIHRDLKPANVMVGAHGEVQVMDWGLAKAIGETPEPLDRRNASSNAETVLDAAGDLDRTRSFQAEIETPERGGSDTRTGSVMGTPAYMPPEQAAGDVHAIDARSDVFGLGAILCEILTGKPPYLGGDVHAIHVQAVRGDTSEALSRLDDAVAEPELTALCKKCLAFRQSDRPDDGRAVANAVAEIRQAAEARARQAEVERERAVVQAAEQAKRRRSMQWAAGIVTVVLLAGIVGTSLGMRKAWQQEGFAKFEAGEKGKALEASETNLKQAKKNLAFAKKGNEFLGSVFEGLNPKSIAESGRPLQDVLRENLGKAVKELEGSAIGDPVAAAEMQITLGRSLIGLGEYEQSIALFKKSLDALVERFGSDHPDSLTALHNLAGGHLFAGKPELALPLYEQSLKRRKAALGANHYDTLQTMSDLATCVRETGRFDSALPLFKEAFEAAKATLGPTHSDTLVSMSNLARAYQDVGDFEHALPLHQEALKLMKATLGDIHPATLQTMNSLSSAHRAAGKFDLSLALDEEALRLSRAHFGVDHPDTVDHLNNLALGLQAAGKLDQAVARFEEAVRLSKLKLGDDHPKTLTSMNNLAFGYRVAGKVALALPLYEATLKLQKARLGADHPSTLSTMNNLAMGYWASGKRGLALPLFEETTKLMTAKLGNDHQDTLVSRNNLASVYQAVGRVEQALPLLEETLAAQKTKLGADHPHTLMTMGNLASCLKDNARVDRALPLYEETLRLMKAKLGADHPQTLVGMGNLASGYREAGKNELAQPIFEEGLKAMKATLGADHPNTLAMTCNFALSCHTAGKIDQSLQLFQTAAEGFEKRRFQDPNAATYMDRVVAALEAAKRWDDAERWRRKWLQHVKESSGEESPAVASELTVLGLNLLQQFKWADAQAVLTASLAIRQKNHPDHWTTYNTQSMLGEALLGQKKFAEAEPMLVKGYEAVKAREKTIPPNGKAQASACIDRLVRLYEAMGKKDEAAKWRKELEASKK